MNKSKACRLLSTDCKAGFYIGDRPRLFVTLNSAEGSVEIRESTQGSLTTARTLLSLPQTRGKKLFAPSFRVHLELLYDSAALQLTVLINGRELASRIEVDERPLTQSIGLVVFSGTAKFSRISVTPTG